MSSASGPWMRQAECDLAAARALPSADQPPLRCQVLAKCQQTVETSIKAIAAELTHRRIVSYTIGFDHSVDPILSAIARAPRDRNDSLFEHLRQVVARNRSDVDAVMALAPRRPASIAQLPRNTEYPYHNHQGVLIAPADAEAFTDEDVARFLKAAGTVSSAARRLIAIADRAPR